MTLPPRREEEVYGGWGWQVSRKLSEVKRGIAAKVRAFAVGGKANCHQTTPRPAEPMTPQRMRGREIQRTGSLRNLTAGTTVTETDAPRPSRTRKLKQRPTPHHILLFSSQNNT